MAKHNSALGLFVGNEGSAGFCFVSCFVLFHLQTVLCILMFVVLVTDFCFLFVSFSFLYLFYFPHSVLSSPVSIAPPPPPMPQLTPQIPLTGFVARVQENRTDKSKALNRYCEQRAHFATQHTLCRV